jgi:DNA-binding transcriptional regulator/RsmH inhibitor MraZ
MGLFTVLLKSSPILTHILDNTMAEKIDIGRQQPLETDSRGRVTIPANIRQKHGIQPEEGKEIWDEVNSSGQKSKR